MTHHPSTHPNADHLAVEPTSLAFPPQAVSTTSAPQIITLSNSGTAIVAITGVGTASTSYTHLTACTSVAPGHSCTITIHFKPQSPGPHSDALTIHTVPAGLLAPVPLTGVGVEPKSVLKDESDIKHKDSKEKDTKEGKEGKETGKDNLDTKVKDKHQGVLEQISWPAAPLTPHPAMPPEAPIGQAFIIPTERPCVGQKALTEPQQEPS